MGCIIFVNDGYNYHLTMITLLLRIGYIIYGPLIANPNKTMAAEINVLIHHGKWESVPRPPAANVVGNKCVYKLKRQADGSSAKLA